MTNAKIAELKTLSNDALQKARAAASETDVIRSLYRANVNAVPTSAQLKQCADLHEQAELAAHKLADAAVDLKSLVSVFQLTLAKTQAARTQALRLQNTPSSPDADTLDTLDSEAVEQMEGTVARVQLAPEMQTPAAGLDAFLQWASTNSLFVAKITATGLVLLVAGCLIYKLLGGVGSVSFPELAKTEYARGLITYLIGVGTIIIAAILVLTAVIGSGDEQSEKSFNRGKEIFTALIGIFGTILGFYFGTQKTEKAPLEITAPVVAESRNGNSAAIAATVSGGKPPYKYSISFKGAPELAAKLAPITSKTSTDGRILEMVDTSVIEKGNKVPFSIEVYDAENTHALIDQNDKVILVGTHESPPNPPSPNPSTPPPNPTTPPPN